MAPEPIDLDGLTWPPELKSRRFDLADGADKSTTRATSLDGLTWPPEQTSLQLEPTSLDGSTWPPEPSLDKSMHQNGSTHLPVNTSRQVDLATRANTSGWVNFAAGANKSRLVDLAPGGEKSRWFDLAAGVDKSTTRADKSRWVELAPEPTSLDKLMHQNGSN